MLALLVVVFERDLSARCYLGIVVWPEMPGPGVPCAVAVPFTGAEVFFLAGLAGVFGAVLVMQMPVQGAPVVCRVLLGCLTKTAPLPPRATTVAVISAYCASLLCLIFSCQFIVLNVSQFCLDVEKVFAC